MLTTRSAILIFSAAMMSGTGSVSSQSYPSKPIRVVTGTPGAGADVVVRVLVEGLNGSLGQPVIVENRVSAVRGEIVARAMPDGYTLLIAGTTTWISTLLQKMPYDIVKDFSPITIVETFPFVVVVNPLLPVKSITELIALAKAKPGALNYGSGGTGSGTHLGPELFKSMAGVNIVRIPYAGAGPAVNGILSGEVQLTFLSPGTILPHVKSGKLRALAVTTAQPTSLAPGLPTVTASGLPGFETVSATAMWAPARTPTTVVNRLNQETIRILGSTDMKTRMLNSGSEPMGNSPIQAEAFLKSEMAKWGKVIKDAGIRGE